jgi:hypothetical protein
MCHAAAEEKSKSTHLPCSLVAVDEHPLVLGLIQPEPVHHVFVEAGLIYDHNIERI